MTDIGTTIAEVKRLDAEATPGEWRAEADPGTDCEACLETSSPQAALVRSYHSAGGIAVVLTDDREKANAALIAYYRTAAPLLAAEVERLRAELDQTDRTNAEIGADRERLRAEVERHKAAASAVREEALDDAAAYRRGLTDAAGIVAAQCQELTTLNSLGLDDYGLGRKSGFDDAEDAIRRAGGGEP